MSDVMFVSPLFKERVWGGSRLAHWYPGVIPAGTIGECWAVSGLPGDAGTITTGAAAGMGLDEAWVEGLVSGRAESGTFPLLAKFLDTSDWLSVQVHPNDHEAKFLECQDLGKAECWYVVACSNEAELILGHDCDTAEDLRASFDDGSLGKHLLTQPVSPGDFFNVPAGSIHAVGPSMLVYEVQQSSDITYRLYDFDRPGLDGLPRELHVEKGFSVVAAPFDPSSAFTAEAPVHVPGGSARLLVSNDAFVVTEVVVDSAVDLTSDRFCVVAVIKGSGTVTAEGHESHRVSPGKAFVVPVTAGRIEAAGDMILVVAKTAEGLTA